MARHSDSAPKREVARKPHMTKARVDGAGDDRPGRIEDYAIIGDCETAALVSRVGSIDWLCWPRFDSGACFAALLGTAKNGRWLLAPCDAPLRTKRRYIDDTLILETTFETETGTVS